MFVIVNLKNNNFNDLSEIRYDLSGNMINYIFDLSENTKNNILYLSKK